MGSLHGHWEVLNLSCFDTRDTHFKWVFSASAVGANPRVNISARPISQEPMVKLIYSVDMIPGSEFFVCSTCWPIWGLVLDLVRWVDALTSLVSKTNLSDLNRADESIFDVPGHHVH